MARCDFFGLTQVAMEVLHSNLVTGVGMRVLYVLKLSTLKQSQGFHNSWCESLGREMALTL